MNDHDAEIMEFLEEAFEQNYELLRLEGGGSLSPDAKAAAMQQVRLYWRKMRDVAERVTDTEVRLNLPGQETPRGRDFAITGVVDIVRDDDRTIMYDIKTHDAEYVRTNIELYEKQLNVYAYIWQALRGQPLDEAGVIATAYPESVKEALSSGDEEWMAHALGNWEPLVPIPFDRAGVQATIEEFGEIVDAIEDGEFAPCPVEVLQERFQGTNTLFATRVCRNCDARFSCASYRRYALEGRGRPEIRFRQYFGDLGTDLDQEEWRMANLGAAGDAADLIRDFVE